MSSTVSVSGCAAGRVQPARRPRPPGGGSAAPRRPAAPAVRPRSRPDGVQPSSASWCSTSGSPAVLRLASTLPGDSSPASNCSHAAISFWQVGGRPVERHGRRRYRRRRRPGPSDRSPCGSTDDRVGDRPPTARRRPAPRRCASLRSTGPRCVAGAGRGCAGRRFSNAEFHHTNPSTTAHTPSMMRLAFSTSTHGSTATEHEHADHDEVDDPVGPPGEQAEGAERAVDDGRVEDHQPAGERRHDRVEALQAHRHEHHADEVLRRLVQPERPQHSIVARRQCTHASPHGARARHGARLRVGSSTRSTGRDAPCGHIMPGMPPMPPPPPAGMAGAGSGLSATRPRW